MAQRMIRNTKTRNRAAMDPSIPKKLTPAVVSLVELASPDTARLTFSTRVMARGLPAFKAGLTGAETVQSVTTVSGTVLELVFTGTVAMTDMLVDEGDPAIRTPTGGFVPAGTYAIPGVVP